MESSPSCYLTRSSEAQDSSPYVGRVGPAGRVGCVTSMPRSLRQRQIRAKPRSATMKTLQIDVLGDDLGATRYAVAQDFRQSERLLEALRQAREEIATLREEVDKLCAPPSTYGVYLSAGEDDTVDVLAQGRKVKVRLHPAIKAESLRPGQELVLNEALNVIAAAGYEIQGDVVALKERLEGERAIVMLRADVEKIADIDETIRSMRLNH